MSIYSGDEDCGDEITSPDPEQERAQLGVFDAFLARCVSDCIEAMADDSPPMFDNCPPCPHCDGRGYVRRSPQSPFCPHCYGTGKVLPPPKDEPKGKP